MEEDRNPSFEERTSKLVVRFETMLRQEESRFFDVDEYEDILDHYIMSRKINKAFIVLGYAKSQHPASSDFHLREAALLAVTNKPDQALELLQKIEAIESSNPELYITKATVYSQLGQFEKAIDNLKMAARLSDEDIDDIYLSLAVEYQNSENYLKAIKYLKLALKENPKNEDALYEIAWCYDQVNKTEDSIKFYKEFIDNNPYSSNAWYNLGCVYSKIDLSEKALEAFDYAIIIQEDFIPAYLNKANSLYRLGRYQLAINTYKETFRMEAPDASIHYYIGECFEKTEDYQKALVYYNKAIRLDANLADAWLGIGIVFDYQGRLSEGIHYIKKAIELDGKNPDFWYVFAEFEEKLGFIEEARYAYQKVIEFEPENTDVGLDLSNMLIEQGQDDNALEVIASGIKNNPATAELYYRMAAYLLMTGQLEEGSEVLGTGLELDYDKHNELFEYFPAAKKSPRIINLIDSLKK